jgi:hypothetical protein
MSSLPSIISVLRSLQNSSTRWPPRSAIFTALGNGVRPSSRTMLLLVPYLVENVSFSRVARFDGHQCQWPGSRYRHARH